LENDVPTVIEQLNGSVDSGGLDQRLGVQVGALQQAIALAGPLLQGKTPSIDTLIGSLGALRTPAFDGGGGFGGALDQAISLAPTDLASVVAPVEGRFGEMATLVEERLKPILEDAVKAAQSIQQLLNVRLGCPDGVPGASASATPPAPPPPGQPAPPSRVAAAAEQIEQLDATLALVPSPIDAAALLQLLLLLVGNKRRDSFFSLNVPVLDDLVDPLQTLVGWSAMDAAAIASQMAASLGALTDRVRECAAVPLVDLGATLAAAAPQWRRAQLIAAADSIADGLTALDAALQAAGDASGPLAALNTALDDYDALRLAMAGDVLAGAANVIALVNSLPQEMLDLLTHVLVLLQSTNVASRLTDLIGPFQPIPPDAIEAVRGEIQPVIDWLRDLVGLLDFGSVQDEIAQVASAAQSVATEIEAALTGVALDVQSAFNGVGAAIQGIGIADLRNQLTTQIEQFGEQLRRDIENALSPARDGVHAAIDAVSSAFDAFDPNEIVDALHDVINSIAGVLNGPEVQAAINAVKQAIDAVVDALKSLSFAPVTDEVVALINSMKDGLKAIIDKDLNDATKAALGAAMSLLPGDLHPVTDPLLVDFDHLVTSGPLAVVASVKDAPKRLLDEVKRFEPAALIGDKLSTPYRALVHSAEGFGAAKLFAAADAELQKSRQLLLQTASPSRALAPLSASVQQLFAKLDAFKPSALLDPLTEKVEQTVAQIIEASPVDEILAEINGVFDAVRDVLTFVQRIESVGTRIGQLFDSLANADAQLDAWRDELLAKVPDGADAGLQTALTALTTAIDGAAHTAVLAAFDAAGASLLAELDPLDPDTRLNRIVTAYGRLASHIGALPASPTKDAAQQILNRFNPTQPLHSAPLRVAGDVRDALHSARSALVALASDWTETVDGLGDLRDVSPTTLRDLLSAEIDPALRPVRFLFTSLGNLAAPVNGVVQTLTELITTLTDRVDALVNGPGSLSAISGAVQQVVDLLRNIDLGFVGRSLDDVLSTVRDQLRAIDPQRLGDELDAAFAQTLSALSLSTIIPAADIAALDQAWQSVLDKLRQLDPGKLIEDVVQPVYDQTVLPLLDAFDLTPLFAALIDFLQSLKGELGSGLDEVNSAYQSLIALRPGGGASASIGA
jgi:phage-related protein